MRIANIISLASPSVLDVGPVAFGVRGGLVEMRKKSPSLPGDAGIGLTKNTGVRRWRTHA
jgi:hypothetical protein